MTAHPFIVVDEKAKVRAPYVRGMLFLILNDGFSVCVDRVEGGVAGWLEWDASRPSVVVVRDAGRKREIAVGDGFTMHKRRFRIERGDELVVDAHRSTDGAHVLFNVVQRDGSTSTSERWRAFAVDDPSRGLLDHVGTVWARSSFGVVLERIVKATTAARADMELAVARGMVDAMVQAAESNGEVPMQYAVVTWDGASATRIYRMPPGSKRPEPASVLEQWRGRVRDELTGVVAQLCGARLRDVTYDDVVTAKPATPDHVAAVVRALFPDEWAIENAVREQVAMIDVRSLPSR